MVIHVFHISVDVLVKGFYVSVNVLYCVVKVISCYIRCDRMGRRDNINCFNGLCWAGACVCGGIHCEEYRLVVPFGLFVDNKLVREYNTYESVKLMILSNCR